MPIDKVTRKKHEATTEERIAVIEKNAQGESYREIAEIAGISMPQAADSMKEWQQHNKEDSNRSGRSSKLSGSDVRYLKMLSDKDPSAPHAEISREGVLIVSEEIVSRALREKGTLFIYLFHLV
jgi:transposase